MIAIQALFSIKHLHAACGSVVFQDTSQEIVQQILQTEARFVKFKKGEIIYSPEQFEHCAGLLLSGSAVVEKGDGAVILKALSASDWFGVSAVFSDSHVYVTTIRVKADCLIAFFESAAMMRIFCRYPQICYNYLRFLSSRIQFLNQKIDSFTAGTAEQRLVHYLLQWKQEDKTIDLPVSYAKLAEMLDIGRSSLYRALDALQKAKVLEKQGKHLRILDEKALENWSEKTIYH